MTRENWNGEIAVKLKYLHPKKDDHGLSVELRHPSTPTDLACWSDPSRLATTVPGAVMPNAIGALGVESWWASPTDDEGWEQLARAASFPEPELSVTTGKRPASGAVIIEDDGRVWVISPSNQFGGYQNTFPKGRLFSGQTLSLRANALKEVFEETGLRVELRAHLMDAERSLTTTRYYLARRIGGNPADMGWETQAVHLVPQSQLPQFVGHPNDRPVVQAILRLRRTGF